MLELRVELALGLLQLLLNRPETGLGEPEPAVAADLVGGDQQVDVRAVGIEVSLGVGESIGSAQLQVTAGQILEDGWGDDFSILSGEAEHLVVEQVAVLARWQQMGIGVELAADRRPIISLTAQIVQQRRPGLLRSIDVANSTLSDSQSREISRLAPVVSGKRT